MPTSAMPTQSVSRDVVRFLLDRIDEDESELKRLARKDVAEPTDGVRNLRRLRAELDAKRRLIGALQHLVVLRDQPAERVIRHEAEQMLRSLAVPYQGHPDYLSRWRPAGSH